MLKVAVYLLVSIFAVRGLSLMSKTLFVLIPGNGGCGSNTLAANWYGWLNTEMKSRSWAEINVSNFPDEFENNKISQYELRDRWKSHVHQVQSTLILLAFTKCAIVWRYGTLNVREEFAKERHHWFAYLRKCAASGHRLISIIMQHAIVRSEVTLLPTIR